MPFGQFPGVALDHQIDILARRFGLERQTFGHGDGRRSRHAMLESDAVTKYDEALAYAPAWPELKTARDTVAARIK